jgi:uncharacterized protein (TIGR02246 family)
MVLAGCGTMSPKQEDVRQAIEANNDKWEQALSRGDASAIAALYTPNAQLLPANGNIVSGHQAIREYWQGAIAAGFKAVTLTALEVESFGDTAYEVGKYSVPGEGGAAAATGDYIVVWKRDGEWKLHRDIWTTNAPASQ